MKSIFALLFAVLPFAAALPNIVSRASSSNNGKNYGPHHVSCKKGKTYPVDFSFAVVVPTIADVEDIIPTIKYGGYRFALPGKALSGLLVSFIGNFDTNQTTMSQITVISESNSVEGGVSFTNATAFANETAVIALTYSSGNASSAGAAAQSNVSVTSTSSSGTADSSAIAVANAAGVVAIATSADADAAANAQSLDNAGAAAAATSCAANNEGATASAELDTTVVWTTSNGTTVYSVAYAACEAGVLAPGTVVDTGSSASGSQASLADVSASVTCNGVVSTNQREQTTFQLRIVGVWVCGTGFEGAIAGQRIAQAESSC